MTLFIICINVQKYFELNILTFEKVLAQNTPQIMFYSMLKLSPFEGH